MITFETIGRKKSRGPILADVETNQFFIDLDGDLCQKFDDTSYNVIANDKFKPNCDRCEHASPSKEIKAVLQFVTKINFKP